MKYENYDLSFPEQPVVDLYLPVWAKLPAFRHKPAFIWVEDSPDGVSSCSTLTYEQLNNSVQSISEQFHLQRGDTVVILCAPGLELVEMIFACQRAGLLAVPIIPPHPSFANENHHHLIRVLSQTRPKAALALRGYIDRLYLSSSTNKRFSDLLQKLQWIPIEEIKAGKLNVQRNLSSYNGCKPDDLYLIQYTSGATAIPKPVLVTAGAAAHNVRTARKAYDLHPNSVIVSWLPQYHDCGLMFLLLTVISGATCVLTSPNAFINRPRLWLELITQYKATCTPVPSFTLPLVVKRGGIKTGTIPISLGSMKNLIIINEPIYKAAIEDFIEVFKPFGLNPACISPSYGLAENCTFVSTAWRSGNHGNFPVYKNLLPSAKLQAPSSNDEEEDIEILVVNEGTHEPVDDGIEGEVWISSPSNANGYLGHPSLTQEVFNGRIKNKRTGKFLRTGDRGIVIGQDRYLYITGRCSDIIKLSNGLEIHPHYIETTAYNSCPKLLRAGCLAAFQVSRTIAIVAELQKTQSDPEISRKICEEIRKSVIKEEQIEVGLVVLVKSGNLPKTTSGKIKRWAAKYKLKEGGMNVIMQMKFDNNAQNVTSFDAIIRGNEEEEKGTKISMGEKADQGFIHASVNASNHLSLRSSL
ncbi:long-chain-fatty-acid--AMP ligase 29-like [Olea europaea subsp. europaea]|uniref:Long-chain-fatty-acid--AMP ligase 29-like n=1 Tax=Olea europaea subsp. europaea TaxID=158383 RepID=A0A8S0PLD7_OLEEU|nr:long-chain-fatty-acid--AMP ligase 29-like [Olea europaea subsp. europaea]